MIVAGYFPVVCCCFGHIMKDESSSHQSVSQFYDDIIYLYFGCTHSHDYLFHNVSFIYFTLNILRIRQNLNIS